MLTNSEDSSSLCQQILNIMTLKYFLSYFTNTNSKVVWCLHVFLWWKLWWTIYWELSYLPSRESYSNINVVVIYFEDLGVLPFFFGLNFSANKSRIMQVSLIQSVGCCLWRMGVNWFRYGWLQNCCFKIYNLFNLFKLGYEIVIILTFIENYSLFGY